MVKHGKAEQAAARSARLSAALRENLKRRKAQVRGRAGDGTSGAADTTIAADPDFRRNSGSKSGIGSGRPGTGRGG
jgi:hypothetical protein